MCLWRPFLWCFSLYQRWRHLSHAWSRSHGQKWDWTHDCRLGNRHWGSTRRIQCQKLDPWYSLPRCCLNLAAVPHQIVDHRPPRQLSSSTLHHWHRSCRQVYNRKVHIVLRWVLDMGSTHPCLRCKLTPCPCSSICCGLQSEKGDCPSRLCIRLVQDSCHGINHSLQAMLEFSSYPVLKF